MKRAFSLVELSVVILIIGILIAGITQSSRLVNEYRLSNARSLTESSPASSIPNLAAWWETTLPKSILETESENETKVSQWSDMSPQSSSRKIISQDTSDNQPQYIRYGINNLPALKFDGSQTYFQMDYDPDLNPENMSIFIVAKSLNVGNGSFGALVSSRYEESSSPEGYIFYKASNSQYEFWASNSGAFWQGIGVGTAATSNQNDLLYAQISDSEFITYYNGTLSDEVSISFTANNEGNLRIGAGYNESDPLYFYDGYIAEIIIFSRVLKTEERIAVQNYLDKKWNIAGYSQS